MPRPRSNPEIEIFNFSFLDIMGCTIGGLLFILMLVTSNISTLPKGPPRHSTGDRVTQTGLERELREANAALARESMRLRPVSPTAPAPRDEALEARLKEDLDAALRETANLRSQVAALQQQARVPKKTEGIPYRIPVLHETEKEMGLRLFLEGGRIFFYPDDFNVARGESIQVGGQTFASVGEISRKPEAVGETLASLGDPRSRLSAAIGRLNPGSEFLFLRVWADSFPLFRSLRSYLWSRGFELNWEPYAIGTKAVRRMMGGGGGRSSVQ